MTRNQLAAAIGCSFVLWIAIYLKPADRMQTETLIELIKSSCNELKKLNGRQKKKWRPTE